MLVKSCIKLPLQKKYHHPFYWELATALGLAYHPPYAIRWKLSGMDGWSARGPSSPPPPAYVPDPGRIRDVDR